jgi:hypothetical protein
MPIVVVNSSEAPGVDPEKIALTGVSFGGYLAPRAAALEKRISALVANDRVYDFGVTQLAAVPPDQRESYIAAVQQKDAPELDRKIVEGSNKSPAAKWAVDQAGFVMGEPTPHATVAKILQFTLVPAASRSKSPALRWSSMTLQTSQSGGKQSPTRSFRRCLGLRRDHPSDIGIHRR